MKKTREQIAAEKEAEQKEIDCIVQKLGVMLPKTPACIGKMDSVAVLKFKGWHMQATRAINKKRKKLDELRHFLDSSQLYY